MATYCENSCSFGLRYIFMVQYNYLFVNLVFSHLGFWSGNLFLIAPFPDRCLLVPSYVASSIKHALAHACHDHPDLIEVKFRFYLCISL